LFVSNNGVNLIYFLSNFKEKILKIIM